MNHTRDLYPGRNEILVLASSIQLVSIREVYTSHKVYTIRSPPFFDIFLIIESMPKRRNSFQSRNLLLECSNGVYTVISSDASDYSFLQNNPFPPPSSRDWEENSRRKLSSSLHVRAWLEVKTFAYPLPYLEHVGLRRRPARQIASSIFNKALKGPRGFVERRYKVNFDVGGESSSGIYGNKGVEGRKREREWKGERRGQEKDNEDEEEEEEEEEKEKGRRALSSFHCKCQAQDFRHCAFRPCPRPSFFFFFFFFPPEILIADGVA